MLGGVTMPGDLFNYAIKSPVDSILILSDGTVLNLPVASGATFDRAVEIKRLTTTNCRGLVTTALRVEAGEDPSLELKYGLVTPDLLGLKTNRRWTTASSVPMSYYRTAFDVPVDGVVPAQPSGTYGFAIAANAVSKCSMIGPDGLSTEVVQQATFASFAEPADAAKFAVGAAGAMKFGSTLFGKSVAINIPFTLTNVKALGSLPFVGMSMKTRVLLNNAQYLDFVFPSVSVDPTGAIDLTANETTVKFYVNGNYDVYSPGLLNAC
jgi:hypothetical protein